jgi:transcriptional regulator with XRE-family HTH domain
MTKLEPKLIGARIKKQRSAIGITQAELAERVDLETVYVSQLERGARLPSLEVLFRIASAIQVRPGSLLDEEQNENDDALMREIRGILEHWSPKKRRAVLNALRALSEV